MYLVLLLAATALLGNTSRAANVNKQLNLFTEIDNNIDVQSKPLGVRKFVTVNKKPSSSHVRAQGEIVELSCDAVGSPAPSIHWFRDNAPIYQHDMESNELINTNPSSVGQITSTLFVPGSFGSHVYTCLATSGVNSARATTTVYNTGGSTELSERAKLYPLKPRIVVSYKIYMDNIGTNIVLPCRVKGHPKPHVTWFDNKGHLVKNNPRIKVLRSGELEMTALRWVDMGQYTCQASNMFGTQLAKTFLYPAKPEKNDVQTTASD